MTASSRSISTPRRTSGRSHRRTRCSTGEGYQVRSVAFAQSSLMNISPQERILIPIVHTAYGINPLTKKFRWLPRMVTS
ncbi:hypothetical protein B296_00017331 [Ensete ventricosum]|uniref:Uncharacterized protein n=1 Tax=Ensete ventricosum TaxID=4639 RepID=A0A427B3M3_ENSVE|nr:hypothetical protein B296_00017331 [Ensete ventricosum]